LAENVTWLIKYNKFPQEFAVGCVASEVPHTWIRRGLELKFLSFLQDIVSYLCCMKRKCQLHRYVQFISLIVSLSDVSSCSGIKHEEKTLKTSFQTFAPFRCGIFWIAMNIQLPQFHIYFSISLISLLYNES